MAVKLADRLHDIGGLSVQISTSDIAFSLAQKPFPPSQWLSMERDKALHARIEAVVSKLKSSGALVELIRIKPLALKYNFFSDRITGLSELLSAKIYNLFLNAKIIDKKGFLLEDPRASSWRESLSSISAEISPDSLIADKSPIAEEMNVAFAFHEITSDFMDKTFAFFDNAAKLYPPRNSHRIEH